MNVPLDAYRDWEDIYVPNITEAIMSDSEATRQLFHVTHAARDPWHLRTSAVPSVSMFCSLVSGKQMISLM